MKAPKPDATPPTVLLTIPTGKTIVYLAHDATSIYFTYYNSGVYRIAKGGGTPVQIATGGTKVAVDDARVYWLDGTALRAICKDGTGSQVLATTNGPTGLAVDSTGVYWADDGKIRKIAK